MSKTATILKVENKAISKVMLNLGKPSEKKRKKWDFMFFPFFVAKIESVALCLKNINICFV